MLLTAEQVMECPLIILPDMNQADIDREWEAMLLRQRAVEEFYEGVRVGRWDAGHVEAMLDMLAEHEIDPLEFAGVVIDNVGFVLGGGCAIAADVAG